jgi:hypothetical protein
MVTIYNPGENQNEHQNQNQNQPESPQPAAPAQPPPRPKPPVSEEKRLANIANGFKSAAGRSPEGKAAAAKNAVTHGMTSSDPNFFLPDEDPEEFKQDAHAWSVFLNAETKPEMALVTLAVYELWKRARSEKAAVAGATRRIEQVQDDFDDRTANEVRTLIPQIPSDPGRVIAALRKSVHGCQYLLDQFSLIISSLDQRATFEVSERRWVTQLLGFRPCDLFTQHMVFEIDRLYLGSLGGTGSFSPEEAANALLLDRPEDMSDDEFTRRLELMTLYLPTVEESQARLVQLIEATMDELKERIGFLTLREARDRQHDVDEAGDDVSRDGQNHKRYANMAIRQHLALLRGLYTMQDLRRKYGAGVPDDPGEDSPGGYEPEETTGSGVPGAPPDPPGPPPEPPPSPIESAAQNGTTVTQVVGAAYCCGEPPTKSEPLRIPSDLRSLAEGFAVFEEWLRQNGHHRLLE